MSRKALLVGINNFTRPSWKLRGCINDTVAMKDVLQKYFSFGESEIKILHDQEASYAGIRSGLDWLLTDYEGEGHDVRVFHFSSHGTQAEDQDHEEWEGKDEVLVPYDHDWDAPFRDDEIRERIDLIPEDVNFTFVADCCHSGSIQKALLDSDIEFYRRYLTPPHEVRQRIAARCEQRDADCDSYVAAHLPEMLLGVPAAQLTKKMEEFIPRLRKQFRVERYGTPPAEKQILLAACEDSQTAADARIEGEFRGAFTWALTRAIQEANGELTYTQLIQNACAKLGDYEQKPQLECPLNLREVKVFKPLVEGQAERMPA
ncbi:MAG: caspase family protein [Caldilineaceae bacterium]